MVRVDKMSFASELRQLADEHRAANALPLDELRPLVENEFKNHLRTLAAGGASEAVFRVAFGSLVVDAPPPRTMWDGSPSPFRYKILERRAVDAEDDDAMIWFNKTTFVFCIPAIDREEKKDVTRSLTKIINEVLGIKPVSRIMAEDPTFSVWW